MMNNWPKLEFPRRINEKNLSGEVYKIPGGYDLKPSIAVLNDREMLVFTHHSHFEDRSHFSTEQMARNRTTEVFHTVMYRTEDGGKTWQCCGHMPFCDGFEASATVIDGVVYVQTHEFPHLNADQNCVIARIFCSEDKGYSWYETRLDPVFFGIHQDTELFMDRNFIRLTNGAVAGFITARSAVEGYTMRLTTRDHGRTWNYDRVEERVTRVEGCNRPILVEAFFFRTPKTHRLMAVSRVEWALIDPEQKQRIPHSVKQDLRAGLDSADGILLLESKDEGLTWEPVRGLGYLSMMYPSVAYINEEDFVFTYTLRTNTSDAPYLHMGVQAVLGKERSDGSFEFHFDQDVIVIDDRTSAHSYSGGGYGCTYMLSDGSFITPYSYRINAPVFEEILSTGRENDMNVFLDYYRPSKQKRNMGMLDEQVALKIYKDASQDLRRTILTVMAEERLESFCKSEVLKWKLK